MHVAELAQSAQERDGESVPGLGPDHVGGRRSETEYTDSVDLAPGLGAGDLRRREGPEGEAADERAPIHDHGGAPSSVTRPPRATAPVRIRAAPAWRHCYDRATSALSSRSCDMCVLFTAHDAYMRGYRVLVPADCVAARKPADRARSLGLMRRALGADTRPSPRIDLEALAKTRGRPSGSR
jgi:hypothetical protein